MQDIESARLAYVRFKTLPAGHVFIIFRFANGEEVALSPQAAVKDGETFSLLRGFFKTYRLRYFFREPRAFIEEYRKNGRKVIESPLALTQRELETLNQRMRVRAIQLEEHPEWYHTSQNSCVTEVLASLDEVLGRKRLLPPVLLIVTPNRLSRITRPKSIKPIRSAVFG